jgi:hypothetical protein
MGAWPPLQAHTALELVMQRETALVSVFRTKTELQQRRRFRIGSTLDGLLAPPLRQAQGFGFWRTRGKAWLPSQFSRLLQTRTKTFYGRGVRLTLIHFPINHEVTVVLAGVLLVLVTHQRLSHLRYHE